MSQIVISKPGRGGRRKRPWGNGIGYARNVRLYELAFACRIYSETTDFDRSLNEFRTATAPAFDPSVASHRLLVLNWLNAWGCRQFAKTGHEGAAQQLYEWWLHCNDLLPAASVTLLNLNEGDLTRVGRAYSDLQGRVASRRARRDQKLSITFGPTGVAKVFFALRPQSLPPWDESIRSALGYDNSSSSYRSYICKVQEEARELAIDAGRFGIPLASVAKVVRRPNATLPKLMDEYFWVTVTRGIRPPARGELQAWIDWSI
jgi:hypothetical protein